MRFYLKNNFIGPVSSQDMYFVTGAPPERQDYLTFIMPFDFYTWALTLASVAGVSIALIVINKTDSMWSQEPTKKSIFMSKCPSLNILFSLLIIYQYFFQVLHFLLELSLMRPRKFLLRKEPITLLEALAQKLKY